MAKRLEGKVAIVIGAGQTPGDTIGNGRAISVLFAREGASVVLVDRNLAAAQETLDQIASEQGQASIIQADITNDADCRRIIEACMALHGRIDICVYNVGIGDGRKSLEMPETQWDRVFDINIKGLFRLYKHLIPIMEKQESGALINISSIAAITSNPLLAYTSSKSAMNAFTRAIALQYARKGIRANVIMPGLMNTPMAIEGISRLTGIDKQQLIDARNKRVPLKGGMGDAWDVAYAALFLASDEARFISAVMLPVDGAQSMRAG